MKSLNPIHFKAAVEVMVGNAVKKACKETGAEVMAVHPLTIERMILISVEQN